MSKDGKNRVCPTEMLQITLAKAEGKGGSGEGCKESGGDRQ